MTILIIVGILVVLVLMAISIYNKYIVLHNENLEAFSNIGVYLKKRLDLIGNLVETVKGYAKHEKETLENVIAARSKMINIDLDDISKLEEIRKAENELTKTLRSIMALSESYPDLKANQNFLYLQETLQSLETEIEKARRYYNATAKNVNIFISKFPNVIFSGIFKFEKAKLFEAGEEANEAPKIQF